MHHQTPVIPPLPSPDGGSTRNVEPPVIPSFSPQHPPTTPSWAQRDHPQAHPSGYPMSGAYTHTPYPPGSYFMPPVALPPQGARMPATPRHDIRPDGFSTDWTGYPRPEDGLAPPPPPVAPMGTPWAPPGAFVPSTAYSAFQQPLPMGIVVTPAGPMQTFATPYMPAAPMPGMWPGSTPYGVQAQLPPGFAPPPAPPPPRHARPFRQSDTDKFDKFCEETRYGPVLTPLVVKIQKARLELNPLLMPPPDNLDDRPYLKWNMLFRTNQCQRSKDPPHKSWTAGRQQPATWPRVTSLRIVSRHLPWDIKIEASYPDEGVSCGDVIEGIQEFMYGRVTTPQLESATPAHKRVVGQSFHHNRSTAPGVPGGSLYNTLLRCDWLGLHTMFGGLVADTKCVKDICGDELPCTFELKCLQRYPLSDEEIRQHEAREAEAAERSRRRTRSRATSRATSRAASEDHDDS